MKPLAHLYLSEIENYVPGKSKVLGKKTIKLSSNENALGASPKAIESYRHHATQIHRYADGSCVFLREVLANVHALKPEQIVCGAGSDEIISLLTQAFAGIGDEVIYSEHGFLMYPISAKRVGATPVQAKEKNLKADIEEIILAITSRTKIIFVANPNNPTGSYLAQDELESLLERVPSNILVVLDCAYEEFVEAKDYPESLPLVERYKNLVVTRTFSKIYGLASLRIGWSYSSLEIAEILNKVRGPFNVSGPAQIAAIAALGDEEFLESSKNHNGKWLTLLSEELTKIRHLKFYPSVANFILVDFFNKENCDKANKYLLEEGFILREMSAYKLPSCLRITVGTDEENFELVEKLNRFKL